MRISGINSATPAPPIQNSLTSTSSSGTSQPSTDQTALAAAASPAVVVSISAAYQAASPPNPLS